MPRDLSDRVRQLERDSARPRNRKKQKFDFLKNVDVVDFLERCEIANISHATADEVLFSCPFPGHSHGDEKPSAYMNDGSKDKKLTTVWKCHGCGRGGNAVSFLAENEGISRQQAIRELRNAYGNGFARPKDGIGAEFDKRQEERGTERERAQAGEAPKLIDEDHLKRFSVAWSSVERGYEAYPDVMYMYNRGFDSSALQQWEIGYDELSDRITIPVRDPDGALLGFKGRAWSKRRKPKYLILGDTPKSIRRHGVKYGFEPYEKSLVVFGLHAWGEQETYVFVEGEIDVISLWMLGIPAFCTGGAHISDEQARLIRDYCNHVVMFLDEDSAGSNGIWGWDGEDGEHHPGAVEKLEPFMRVDLVGPHPKDVNDYMLSDQTAKILELIECARPAFTFRRRGAVL